MKIGYSPVSIFAQLCGSAAAAAAAVSPATAGVAAGVGTFVNAIFGGIEIKGEDKNIRADLTRAMDTSWDAIQKKYDLTVGCMTELKMEIMGERTSVGEFVRNSQSVGLKYAVTDVIESILQRHVEDLNKNTRYVWSKRFTREAASEIASILIGSIEDVFESNDSLRILKAIVDSDARRRQEYQGISNQLGEINSKVDQFIDIQTVGGISTGKIKFSLPPIKEKILSPCEPFIEGTHRREDLSNIYSLLTSTNKPLWLYGERGIGKTELIRQFAKQHPENEYIFTAFSGSINQTVSKNLFFFREYESNGTELSDIVRYQKNMAAFSEYSRQLKEERRNLIFIIDNYYPFDYEKKCREEMELDIHSGISGESSDINEIKELLKTGVKVILMGQNKPKGSDIYASYEIRGLDEDDHFAVMTGCFTKIVPHLDKEEIREKLLYLIRIAGRRTVFVTIMAFAMQNSKLEPKEALNRMLESFDVDGAYDFRYSSDTLNMHDHIERILGFIGLSYLEKQMLAILVMLPAQGMEYDLFRQLTTANAVQLDKIRQTALQKFIDTNIVTEEYRQKELQTPAGSIRIIRMSPLIADHALRILAGKDPGSLLNSIRMNWVARLIHYINQDELKSLKIDDSKYVQIPMLAEACSATEQWLRKMGERFECEEDVAVSRRDLLMKASELSDKAGNVKNALEYVERAIAVEGPYAEDMDSLIQRMNSVGVLFYKGGQYKRAQKCFLNCLKILDDKNNIFPEDNVKGFGSKDIKKLMETDDAKTYASVFNNVATAFDQQGDYEKAGEYFVKALTIEEKVFGTEHLDTGVTYNNIAWLCRRLGDYEKALEYFSKAVVIIERVLGTEHPYTATMYDNMATGFVDQGDYERALEYYGKALAISERVLGTDHPDTAITYNSMAWMYRDQGDYEKALEYYKKAYEIRLSVFGENNLDTLGTQLNMNTMELLIETGLTEDELMKSPSQE